MQLKGQGVELIINTNLAALNAYNNLMLDYNLRVKSFARLSSSKRINSTADDPVGLAISTKMEDQINGF